MPKNNNGFTDDRLFRVLLTPANTTSPQIGDSLNWKLVGGKFFQHLLDASITFTVDPRTQRITIYFDNHTVYALESVLARSGIEWSEVLITERLIKYAISLKWDEINRTSTTSIALSSQQELPINVTVTKEDEVITPVEPMCWAVMCTKEATKFPSKLADNWKVVSTDFINTLPTVQEEEWTKLIDTDLMIVTRPVEFDKESMKLSSEELRKNETELIQTLFEAFGWSHDEDRYHWGAICATAGDGVKWYKECIPENKKEVEFLVSQGLFQPFNFDEEVRQGIMREWAMNQPKEGDWWISLSTTGGTDFETDEFFKYWFLVTSEYADTVLAKAIETAESTNAAGQIQKIAKINDKNEVGFLSVIAGQPENSEEDVRDNQINFQKLLNKALAPPAWSSPQGSYSYPGTSAYSNGTEMQNLPVKTWGWTSCFMVKKEDEIFMIGKKTSVYELALDKGTTDYRTILIYNTINNLPYAIALGDKDWKPYYRGNYDKDEDLISPLPLYGWVEGKWKQPPKRIIAELSPALQATIKNKGEVIEEEADDKVYALRLFSGDDFTATICVSEELLRRFVEPKIYGDLKLVIPKTDMMYTCIDASNYINGYPTDDTNDKALIDSLFSLLKLSLTEEKENAVAITDCFDRIWKGDALEPETMEFLKHKYLVNVAPLANALPIVKGMEPTETGYISYRSTVFCDGYYWVDERADLHEQASIACPVEVRKGALGYSIKAPLWLKQRQITADKLSPYHRKVQAVTGTIDSPLPASGECYKLSIYLNGKSVFSELIAADIIDDIDYSISEKATIPGCEDNIRLLCEVDGRQEDLTKLSLNRRLLKNFILGHFKWVSEKDSAGYNAFTNGSYRECSDYEGEKWRNAITGPSIMVMKFLYETRILRSTTTDERAAPTNYSIWVDDRNTRRCRYFRISTSLKEQFAPEVEIETNFALPYCDLDCRISNSSNFVIEPDDFAFRTQIIFNMGWKREVTKDEGMIRVFIDDEVFFKKEAEFAEIDWLKAHGIISFVIDEQNLIDLRELSGP